MSPEWLKRNYFLWPTKNPIYPEMTRWLAHHFNRIPMVRVDPHSLRIDRSLKDNAFGVAAGGA
jgi:hypothetical protein